MQTIQGLKFDQLQYPDGWECTVYKKITQYFFNQKIFPSKNLPLSDASVPKKNRPENSGRLVKKI